MSRKNTSRRRLIADGFLRVQPVHLFTVVSVLNVVIVFVYVFVTVLALYGCGWLPHLVHRPVRYFSPDIASGALTFA